MSADSAIRALHLIAAAVWAGGLVFLGIAVTAARKIFPESRERIAFFRRLGRIFFALGGTALLVLVATGSEMVSDGYASWSERRLQEKLVLVGLVIVLMLFHSLVQGPGLSRLREQALERPDNAELAMLIRAKSMRAGIVNGLILLSTFAILVLAARLVTG